MKIYCPKCLDVVCKQGEYKIYVTCACGQRVHIQETVEKQKHEIMAKAIMLWQSANSPKENLNKFLTAAETSFEAEMKNKAIVKLSEIFEEQHQSLMQILTDINGDSITNKTERRLEKVQKQHRHITDRLYVLISQALPTEKSKPVPWQSSEWETIRDEDPDYNFKLSSAEEESHG